MSEIILTVTHKSFTVPPDLGLTSDQRLFMLKKSNLKLEQDLDSFVDKIKNVPNGHHLWATTYYPLRFDDLQGLALYYYSIEIIHYLQIKFPAHNIKIKGDVDEYYLNFIKVKFPKIIFLRIPLKLKIRRHLSYNISPLIYIKNWMGASLKKEKEQKEKGGIWLSAPADLKKHRYRHLLDRIEGKKIFFSNDLTKRKNHSKEEDCINFYDYVNKKEIIKTYRISFGLKNYLNNLEPEALLEYQQKSINLFHIWNTVLKERTVEKAISNLEPKLILYTTALTHPPARIVARQAYLKKIPFVVVACRPMFTDLRMEERLTTSDLEKRNDAHVADAFVVWDKLSKNTLIDQGVPENEVFVAQPEYTPQQIKKTYNDSLLVLLTHEEALNDKLINSILKIKKLLKLKLIIRQHPARKVTDSQKLKLLSIDKNYSNCTDLRLNEIIFEKCLAVTINSTVGIEAVQRGCGLVWLPFLNDRALIFKSVMETLGFEAKSQIDFKQFIEKIAEPDLYEKFILKCENSFQIYFEHKDETEFFLKKFNLNYIILLLHLSLTYLNS